MSEDTFIAATEHVRPEVQRPYLLRVLPGERLFKVSHELASRSLNDWSEPVQLRLEKDAEEGAWMLVARIVDTPAPQPSPPT